jgi:outer membrane protein
VSADLNAVGATNDARVTASGGLNNPAIFNRQSDGLQVSQMITDFGRTGNLTTGYRYDSEAARHGAEAVRNEVLLQVSQAYLTVLGAESLLKVATQTVSERQLLLDRVKALAKSNLKSSLDVNFAAVDFQEAQLLLLQARDRVDEAYTSLAEAMGTEDCHQYALQDVQMPALLPDVEGLIQQALGERPEIKEAKARRDAALKFAQAEKEAQYPQVNAIGAIGVTPVGDKELSDTYAVGGVNVNVPLLNGGNFAARSKEAELKELALEKDLDDRENRVARDVRIAWLQAGTAHQKIDVTDKLLQTAAQALELAQSRYNIGISSIVELSEAELEKTRAEIAYTESIYDYEIKKTELDYQLGSLH